MPKTFGLSPDRKKVAELGLYYKVMGNKIREELLKLDAGEFSELETISVQQNVQKIVKQMNRYIIRWSKKATIGVYKDATQIAKVSLDVLGAVKDENYDVKTHYRTIENYQELTAKDLIKANSGINVNVATYIYLLRQASKAIVQIQEFDLRDEEIISGLLDDAIKEGQSRSHLNQLIRKHFKRDLYAKKFININGKNYDLIKYAKMVARTRLRSVQSDAMKNMCNQFDNDLIEISDHGTETEICKEFEGNTYSISGNTPGYEVLTEWPPFHPNCMHSAAPTSIEAIEWRETH